MFTRLRSLAHRLTSTLDGSSLVAAAGRGDPGEVRRLLDGGADPNARDALGWTALRAAVDGGHAEVAAALLGAGARPGDLAAAPPEILHAIRQRTHRGRVTTEAAPPWLAELDARGVVKLPGFLAAGELDRLRADLARFVERIDELLVRGEAVFRHYDEEEHWWPADRAYVTNNAFKHSRALVDVACRPELLAAARAYFGKPIVIQRALAMRYLASAASSHDMFGWHHDLEDKRMKIMVLVTDVGERDQHMSYVLGSHRLYHPYAMFQKNHCPLDYCRRHLPAVDVYDCVGRAGDAFVFDSNGAHRGNRRDPAPPRDVFLVEYSSDRSELWGADLAAGAPAPAEPALAPLLAAEKKWLRRRRASTAWIESLPAVEKWL